MARNYFGKIMGAKYIANYMPLRPSVYLHEVSSSGGEIIQ